MAQELSQATQAELKSKNERLKLLLDFEHIIRNIELRDLLRAISASVRLVMKCGSVGAILPDANDRLRIHAVDFPEGGPHSPRGRSRPPRDQPTGYFRTGWRIALDAPHWPPWGLVLAGRFYYRRPEPVFDADWSEDASGTHPVSLG